METKVADKKLSEALSVRFSREYLVSAKRGQTYSSVIFLVTILMIILIAWDFAMNSLGWLDILLGVSILICVTGFIYLTGKVYNIRHKSKMMNETTFEFADAVITDKKKVRLIQRELIQTMSEYFGFKKNNVCTIDGQQYFIKEDDLFYDVQNKSGFYLVKFHNGIDKNAVFRVVAKGNY